MIQGTERTEQDADQQAADHARMENRRWPGPFAWTVRIVLILLSLTRVSMLIGYAARRADLHRPQLTTLDVPVAGLPPALVGLRIGHLSDLHVGPLVSAAETREAVDLLQSTSPDLIVFTGDLVDHRPRDVGPAAQVMSHLQAPLGVYGILGNHDHRVGRHRLLTALSEHAPNVRMLINDACRLTINGDHLWLAGIDSVYLDRHDLTTALKAIPADEPCLLLSHEPDVVDQLPRPMLLTLSGHAHGGQIRLGTRPLMLPPLGRRYHTGLYSAPLSLVYTSRGVGWTGLPLRLNCPPEVTVLRLVPAD